MNKIELNIPEGFEIDMEKSNLPKGIIEFKPVERKKLTYEDVAKELFNENSYYTNAKGKIFQYNQPIEQYLSDPNNATSKKQLECLMAYNKLRNVAEYLNLDWKAKWSDPLKPKWFLYFNWNTKRIEIDAHFSYQRSDVYFNLRDSAKLALEVLGEEEIKKALFIY